MPILRYSYLIVCVLLIQSCAVLSPASKYQFSEGSYILSETDNRSSKIYFLPKNDTVFVYPFDAEKGTVKTASPVFIFPDERKTPLNKKYRFRKPTYDLDIITIPVKYRFPTNGFPNQLNAGVNAALYMGFRTDYYQLSYNKNPLLVYEKKVAHFGYSYGLFAGLGSAFISPSVTQQLTNQEYDGFVAMAGFSGNMAINRVTLGLALGFDYLMDGNRPIWIYNEKPWLGLTVGLNLN